MSSERMSARTSIRYAGERSDPIKVKKRLRPLPECSVSVMHTFADRQDLFLPYPPSLA